MSPLDNPLSPKDFSSNQEVRWCPGCGDYAILKALQKVLSDIKAQPEKTVFVSGIGCSSRLPYYMSTYGFHTIHGRAPAIASGIKIANPDLDVWIITGDGDGLSIGGNHLLHLMRRNINCQLLLFNNEIYGLTKGQYSPTSRSGTTSPSTPLGSFESPVSPCRFALGAGATFVARGIDTSISKLMDTLKAGQKHRGTSFVEIFQNCIVYNDDVFSNFTDRSKAKEKQLHLENGKPMIFGTENEKGLSIDTKSLRLKVVPSDDPSVLVHDCSNYTIATLLANMDESLFPIALGILYSVDSPIFEEKITTDNIEKDINSLMRLGQTWNV